MTKAERAALKCVDRFFTEFIDPGKWAGPNLDKNTWNPWSLISLQIEMAYVSKYPPKASMEKAQKLVENEWGKRLVEWQSRNKTITKRTKTL